MAYQKEIQRQAVVQMVLGRAGFSAASRRIWQGQVLSAAEEALLESLPIDTSEYAEIQAPDGSMYFMPDMDPPDSPLYPLL